MRKNKSIIPILIVFIIAIYSTLLIMWDRLILEKDFTNIMSFLVNTRVMALKDEKALIVQFKGKTITLKEKGNDLIINAFEAPTLSRVNYDTTLVKNMIVFIENGTDPYNIRRHGGISP